MAMRSWARPGLLSLLGHAAALAALLAILGGRAPTAAPVPTEMEILAVEAARPRPAGGAPTSARTPSPRRSARPRPVPSVSATPPLPLSEPIATMDNDALPVATGDEITDDGDGDGSEGNDSAAGGAGPATGPGTARDEDLPPLSALEAAYLRTYQTLPGLPPALLWEHGRVYTVVTQICVSATGHVQEVTLKQGAAPELDARVLAALRTWRYRPRIVQGKPRAFCHPMTIHYDVD